MLRRENETGKFRVPRSKFPVGKTVRAEPGNTGRETRDLGNWSARQDLHLRSPGPRPGMLLLHHTLFAPARFGRAPGSCFRWQRPVSSLDGGAAVRFVEMPIADCRLPIELATADRIFIRCFRTSDFRIRTPEKTEATHLSEKSSIANHQS